MLFTSLKIRIGCVRGEKATFRLNKLSDLPEVDPDMNLLIPEEKDGYVTMSDAYEHMQAGLKTLEVILHILINGQ